LQRLSTWHDATKHLQDAALPQPWSAHVEDLRIFCQSYNKLSSSLKLGIELLFDELLIDGKPEPISPHHLWWRSLCCLPSAPAAPMYGSVHPGLAIGRRFPKLYDMFIHVLRSTHSLVLVFAII
jgi:hypothetical protein